MPEKLSTSSPEASLHEAPQEVIVERVAANDLSALQESFRRQHTAKEAARQPAIDAARSEVDALFESQATESKVTTNEHIAQLNFEKPEEKPVITIDDHVANLDFEKPESPESAAQPTLESDDAVAAAEAHLAEIMEQRAEENEPERNEKRDSEKTERMVANVQRDLRKVGEQVAAGERGQKRTLEDTTGMIARMQRGVDRMPGGTIDPIVASQIRRDFAAVQERIRQLKSRENRVNKEIESVEQKLRRIGNDPELPADFAAGAEESITLLSGRRKGTGKERVDSLSRLSRNIDNLMYPGRMYRDEMRASLLALRKQLAQLDGLYEQGESYGASLDQANEILA